MTYQPIENYSIIGDLNTVALVAMNGSIDFMCFPHFDSPSVFAALLDKDNGGRFHIEPLLDNVRHKQIYLPDTNVLVTRFLAPRGSAELTDFMPAQQVAHAHRLVRMVKAVRGDLTFRLTCHPRFDYARASHSVELLEDEVLFVANTEPRLVLRLRTPYSAKKVDGGADIEFTLKAGETASFVLEQLEPGEERHSPSARDDYAEQALESTIKFWRGWIGQSSYQGRWREMVNRSALTLKLLTSYTHGSMVAAPTFGLPEVFGGERNWDYRYAWIRDASFTVYALIRLGLTEEAGAYMGWIEDRCKDLNADGSLQIMFALDGHKTLEEQTLPNLAGYRNSQPVRIGNAAYRQLQMDIYGELMDSVYLYDKHGDYVHHDLWMNLVKLIRWVTHNWKTADEGIWEIRGEGQHFLYSRVMCWVALDRGIRLAVKRSLPAPVERWRKVRNAIYRDVLENFWDEKRGTFVQYKGSQAVDASMLLMPLVKFISPTDPRWLSTLRAIEEDLVEDALVYRYRLDSEAAHDGLNGEEGTFTICSFWYVECLARAGQLEKARYNFEKLLGFANHVGLYAEELNTVGEHLGNFPQAFTHLALISAAFDLNRRLDAPDNGRQAS